MKLLALIAISLAAASCPTQPPAPTPGPDGPPTPDPVLDGGIGCSRCTGPCDCACCVMGSYNSDGVVRCREAMPTARGESCTELCLRTSLFPGGRGLPTLCVENAASIAGLRSCGVCGAPAGP